MAASVDAIAIAWRRLKVIGRSAWARARRRTERLPTALLVLAALFAVLAINEVSYHRALAALEAMSTTPATRGVEQRGPLLQVRVDGATARAQALRDAGARLLAAGTPRAELQPVRDALLSSRLAVMAMALAGTVSLLLVLRHGGQVDGLQRRHRLALQAERARLERVAAERTRDLTELARHLQTVREDERQRLARDLHDELGSLLAAAQLTAARLAHRLGDDAAPEVRARLRELSTALHDGIRLKRRIIEDLHPSTLDHLGLSAALEIQAREFAERAELPVHTEIESVQLTASAQMTAYRLVQEALTNIAKYAQASSVKVSLERDGETAARLCVADDGCGFDPRAAQASAHGLKGMRYRVEAEGGSLHIVSAPGRGTRIAARLPACEAA